MEKTHPKKGKTWNHLNWFKSVFITINHKNQIEFNQAKKMKVLFLFSSVYCASSAKMLFFYGHTQDRAFGSYHSTMKNLHLHTTLVDGPQPKQIFWRSKCFFFSSTAVVNFYYKFLWLFNSFSHFCWVLVVGGFSYRSNENKIKKKNCWSNSSSFNIIDTISLFWCVTCCRLLHFFGFSKKNHKIDFFVHLWCYIFFIFANDLKSPPHTNGLWSHKAYFFLYTYIQGILLLQEDPSSLSIFFWCWTYTK